MPLIHLHHHFLSSFTPSLARPTEFFFLPISTYSSSGTLSTSTTSRQIKYRLHVQLIAYSTNSHTIVILSPFSREYASFKPVSKPPNSTTRWKSDNSKCLNQLSTPLVRPIPLFQNLNSLSHGQIYRILSHEDTAEGYAPSFAQGNLPPPPSPLSKPHSTRQTQ